MDSAASAKRRAARDRLLGWLTQYGDSLYAYALTRVPSPEVAEDLLQETFLAAMTSMEGYEGRSSPNTWLIAILRKKLIDYYRKRARDLSVGDHSEATEGDFDRRGIWSHAPGRWPRQPEAELSNQEFWQAFDDCLAKLPPAQAVAFAMRELDCLDRETVCEQLSISSSNLGIRLHRARLALRNCLEKNWFGDD